MNTSSGDTTDQRPLGGELVSGINTVRADTSAAFKLLKSPPIVTIIYYNCNVIPGCYRVEMRTRHRLYDARLRALNKFICARIQADYSRQNSFVVALQAYPWLPAAAAFC